MPHINVNKPAKVVLFPPPEEKKADKPEPKSAPGSEFFKDVHTLSQMVQVVALLALNKESAMLGLAFGAYKPLNDFLSSNTIPKKGTYEENQKHLGDSFVAETSDPYYQRKLLVAFATLMPIYVAKAFKETGGWFNVLSQVMTFTLATRLGFDWGQHLIQLLNPPASDK